MKKKIETTGAPKADAILSQGIEANGMIFVAGQIHSTPDGQMVEGTVTQKVAQIMSNIEAILKAAGASLNDIVKATIYVTDMAQMPELNQVWPTYFEQPLPAREAVCVSALPLGATIEVSVIAVTK